MSIEELAKQVQEVRTAQKMYFLKRDLKVLEASKQLERDLDKTIKAILDPNKNQNKLF